MGFRSQETGHQIRCSLPRHPGHESRGGGLPLGTQAHGSSGGRVAMGHRWKNLPSVKPDADFHETNRDYIFSLTDRG